MRSWMMKSMIAAWIWAGLAGGAAADHEVKTPGSRRGEGQKSSAGPARSSACLTGKGLAEFANGDAYNFGGMVKFLTDEKCQPTASQVRQDALNIGISFLDEPFRLRTLAQGFNPASLEQSQKMNQSLRQSVPEILRQNPKNSAELLPLIGQLAVLSKSAAKSTIALAIVQELAAADPLLRKAGPEKDELATALAGQVKKLGGANEVIIGELANSVEEMALSAQADSLGKVLRSLGDAANSDAALVPAFDRSLQAGRLGAEKGAPEQSSNERGALLRAFLSAVTPERTNPAASGQAADEFNRAFQALLMNEGLAQTELRTFWKQVVRLLSFSRTQTALAEALALSLTESAIYLNGEERNNLIAACENYPSLAKSLQRQFLVSWRAMWDDLYAKKLKVAEVNTRKASVFVPLVGSILGLEPAAVDDEWLRAVVENKLVRDEEIETRFPKLVLYALKKREAFIRDLGPEPTLEGMLAFSAQAFRSNWTLSTIHIPTLNGWVERQPE